jgi:hypothetical protein
MKAASAIGVRDTLKLRVVRSPNSHYQEASRLDIITGALRLMLVLAGLLVRAVLALPGALARHVANVRTNLGELRASVSDTLPWRALHKEAKAYRWANLHNALRDVPTIFLGILIGSRRNYGVLRLALQRGDGSTLDLGVVSHQLITTAGVNKIVSGLNATDAATFQAFKYLAFGTGAVAPAIADTALGTEFTTQYATDNVRPTGTQGVGGSANVYRVTGTFSPDTTCTPTELGLMSQAATGGGTMLDRFTYTGVPLTGSADSLAPTIDITIPAGS